MPVLISEDWLREKGVAISVEDLHKTQMIYEDPDTIRNGSIDDAWGPTIGRLKYYISDRGHLYNVITYQSGEKNESYREGVEIVLSKKELEEWQHRKERNPSWKTAHIVAGNVSPVAKKALDEYFRDPENFKTVHAEMRSKNMDKEERKEITLKFGKGHVREFTGKNGTEYADINFKDGKVWKHVVVPAKYVHENKFGNGGGVWTKLLEDGQTKVTWSTKNDQGEYDRHEEMMDNKELKSKVEAYKKEKREEKRAEKKNSK